MRLKDIATIYPGYPFRGRIEEVPGTGIFAVQMKNVDAWRGVSVSDCVETELEGKRKPDFLEANDILFAARGSRAYAALLGSEAENLQLVASPHLFVIRINSKQVLPEFLVWQLNQGACQRHFDQNAEGTLTKSIRRSVLEETVITLPAIEKQKSLIALASALVKEQQLLQQLAKNNEALLSSVFSKLN